MKKRQAWELGGRIIQQVLRGKGLWKKNRCYATSGQNEGKKVHSFPKKKIGTGRPSKRALRKKNLQSDQGRPLGKRERV